MVSSTDFISPLERYLRFKIMEEVKLHAGLVKSVAQSLLYIFHDGFYADKVLERAFKQNSRWGSRDRKFVAETVYDMTRWWSLITRLDNGKFVPESLSEYLRR